MLMARGEGTTNEAGDGESRATLHTRMTIAQNVSNFVLKE